MGTDQRQQSSWLYLPGQALITLARAHVLKPSAGSGLLLLALEIEASGAGAGREFIRKGLDLVQQFLRMAA